MATRFRCLDLVSVELLTRDGEGVEVESHLADVVLALADGRRAGAGGRGAFWKALSVHVGGRHDQKVPIHCTEVTIW